MTSPTRRRATAVCLALALAPFATRAQTAAPFPNHPVRLVVPYNPGGLIDTVARLLATRLQEQWKQTVTVENRPGASGSIGAEQVARAPADGHTLLLATSSMLLSSLLDAQFKFDLTKDFDPVSLIGTTSMVLLVSNAMNVQSLSDFATALRAAPGKYSYGTIGNGSSLHLYSEQLGRQLNAQPVHIPYAGGAPILNEMIAGRLDFGFMDQSAARQHVEGGKLKAIGIAGPARSQVFPGVPTLSEAGFPGFELQSWYAVYTTRGTPDAVLQKLSADVRAALEQPDIASRLTANATAVTPTTPAELGRRGVADIQAWTRLARDAKLTTK